VKTLKASTCTRRSLVQGLALSLYGVPALAGTTFSKSKATGVEIPEVLKRWVAFDGQKPTNIVDPCYIDHTAVEDLAFYHPGFDSSTPHSFLHIAAVDERGRPYVRCDVGSFSYNWERKMEAVMRALVLYPRVIDGFPVLVDESIADVETPLMHGWKVVHWRVVENRNTSMRLVHQDIVRWKKADKEVESMFSWRPYLASNDQGRTAELHTQ